MSTGTDSVFRICYYFEPEFQANPPEPLSDKIFIEERPQLYIVTRYSLVCVSTLKFEPSSSAIVWTGAHNRRSTRKPWI